ncbi:uncharacterized protein A1O9_00029 [Exophiala aquamarina CBS 119918]|uniref:Uncharacterized protein n=1 Tax=Exophiala aquamarina CBS 119918 TaxID=1182545 RepID=A0A072PQM3_9EURO|nr:uncharacterized protein A1O9_00029 [Exophiala aquamarina CBS 119918]KEF62057.1 hypothetical protein A1O9_00029 [Exophiala aquamarina CBS 119918]
MSNLSNPPPGSRAIKIPIYAKSTREFTTSNRPRRSERYAKQSERADSDAGPSSLGSDHDSSWSYSPLPGRPQNALQTVASPQSNTRFLYSHSTTPTETSSKRKDKQKSTVDTTSSSPPSAMPALFNPSTSPLGPSMLASSSYKSINLNSHHDDPDEPPRLITYTKHSQGFTWNDELFLPSYLLGRYGERGRKKQYDGDFGDDDHCPVAEIFVTDEEAEAMMP